MDAENIKMLFSVRDNASGHLFHYAEPEKSSGAT